MRFVLFCVTLAIASAVQRTEKEIEKMFDDLLQKDELGAYVNDSPERRAFHLGMFTVGVLGSKSMADVDLDLAFSATDLEAMNGAVPSPDVQPKEELVKREEGRLDDVIAPPTLDNRHMLNDAVHQGSCGNCYLHTFVAALEVANFMANGAKPKFSEQEMTDCYYAGCGGGDYKMVANTFSYINKLSSRRHYGRYLEGDYTCRANQTPDALLKLKVTGFVPVKPDQIKQAVTVYGSVMTCMAWGVREGEPCMMRGFRRDPTSVVDFPALGPGDNDCTHAVLIVGYTSSTWIVRNSHGADWGDNGYFQIARGKNTCGIEDPSMLAALVTEPLPARKHLPPSGCPASTPRFCETTNTCMRTKWKCPAVNKGENTKEVEREKVTLKKRSEEMDTESLTKRASEDCEDLQDPQICSRVSCSPTVAKFCAKTCNSCDSSVDEADLPPVSPERTGNCIKPRISNALEVFARDNKGQKITSRRFLKTGETLSVKCKKGYVKTGEQVQCLISNVFTNADKDARLVPECIKLGSDELQGNGASYTGSKNSYTMGITEIECDLWNMDVLRGVLIGDKSGGDYILGNHNFCRNPDGAHPVPYCLSVRAASDPAMGAQLRYCFKFPGPDMCGEGVEDSNGAEYCAVDKEANCAYTDQSSRVRTDWFWGNCRATCCAVAGY